MRASLVTLPISGRYTDLIIDIVIVSLVSLKIVFCCPYENGAHSFALSKFRLPYVVTRRVIALKVRCGFERDVDSS